MADSSALSNLVVAVFVLILIYVRFLFPGAIHFLIRKMLWGIAVLVRRDEHVADTDEWLKSNFGIEPDLEGMPAAGGDSSEPVLQISETVDPDNPNSRYLRQLLLDVEGEEAP